MEPSKDFLRSKITTLVGSQVQLYDGGEILKSHAFNMFLYDVEFDYFNGTYEQWELLLNSYLESRLQEHKQVQERNEFSNPLFLTSSGTTCTPNTLSLNLLQNHISFDEQKILMEKAQNYYHLIIK